MNIGIFTDTYSPQISGVATSIMVLENELRKQGHNVYIFTTTDPNADRENEVGRVFRMPSIPFLFFPERRIAIAGMNKFIRLVGKLKLDIIHTHTEFSLGLLGKKIAKKYHIPSIHTYHTMYVEYVHYIAKGKILTPAMVKRITRSFCESYDALIAPTPKVKNHLKECGIQKKIVYTIPTGTDIHSFSPVDSEKILSIKSAHQIEKNAPVILSLGRLAHEKNIYAIIESMPEVLTALPKAKLVIVGDGPVKGDLKELVMKKSLEEAVVFTGAIEWQEIGAYYQLGDVFVSASTTETQGLTYFEAMASSVPVVAKQDESIEGVLENEKNAFLFQSDSEIAQTLIKALTENVLSQKIKENGLKQVSQMSAEEFGKNINTIYKKIIERYQPRRNNSKSPSEIPLLKRKIFPRGTSLSSHLHTKKGRSSRRD